MTTLRAYTFVSLTALMATFLASPTRAADITILNTASSNGYNFTNFDGPNVGLLGTTINGISNNGTVVGFTTPDGVNFNNFTANPLQSTSATLLNLPSSAMANGINSAGTIVGSDGNGNAFILSGTTFTSFVPFNGATPPNNGVSAVALGINDQGTVVGQYTTNADITPGFILKNNVFTTINSPSGPDVVNVQGINNNGLAVGFYFGTDGQDHGFKFNASSAVGGIGTGTAIADPTIPNVAGEPGATFMFSQILGINDNGIAVGYYGDSTGSQHGFLYNTNTGQYTFIDDPNAAFDNGVEVTQITGITNSGEIAGFYTDANGVAHGFVGQASVPEPGSVVLLGIGLAIAMGHARGRMRKTVDA